MELTRRRVRQVWRHTARPIYPIDVELVAAARAADATDPEAYAQIQNPAAHQIYRYLTEFVVRVLEAHSERPLRSLRILDWGGGKGYVAYFLKQKGAQVVLYETDAFTHRAIWKKFHLDAQTSPGGRLPFADKSFDAIVSLGVLEHVPYDYEALKEVNRVLRDDGLFFCFNLPNRAGYAHHVAWWRGLRYHDRLYGRREIELLLKRAGLNTIGRPWFRQLLPKNRATYRAPRLLERLDLFATNHTPLAAVATSIEFVARKQHTYTTMH